MQSAVLVADIQEAAHRPWPLPDGFRQRRVLLAEDDPDMRRLIATVLRGDAYEVVEADSGSDLLRHLQNQAVRLERFDAVVADVQLPHLTALEVLTAVPWQPLTTPVILLTAFGTSDTRAEARALGVAAILDKPIDLDDLRAMLRGIATQRRNRSTRDRWDA